MLFNSLEFAVFFPLVTLIYFAIPHRFRWFHLLVASCVFYAAFIPSYLLILAFTIVIDYFAGILIERSRGAVRGFFLLASLIANVGVLAVFKYYAFLIENITALLHLGGIQWTSPAMSIILPIGLSFHTFQAMSYTIEVYRGHQKAEWHFGIYALYVMFYPQLVAGPIERPQNLLHQFREHHVFEYDRVTDGLKLMAVGLFKKIVIADQLAPYVNQVFDHPGQYHGLAIVFATFFFAFQIYYDFSGYSDIAIGSARVMGFRLMTNFNTPYFSASISEFWRRWHISLSTWFRDYLYLPLGGSRTSTILWCRNIMVVFLVSGLWHGANWTFVAWGAIHGGMIIFEGLAKRIGGAESHGDHLLSWKKILAVSRTFVVVCAAWVFFRAASVPEALQLFSKGAQGIPSDIQLLLAGQLSSGFSLGSVALKLAFLAGFSYFEYVDRCKSVWMRLASCPVVLRFSVYFVVVYSTLLVALSQTETQFIYFQF